VSPLTTKSIFSETHEEAEFFYRQCIYWMPGLGWFSPACIMWVTLVLVTLGYIHLWPSIDLFLVKQFYAKAWWCSRYVWHTMLSLLFVNFHLILFRFLNQRQSLLKAHHFDFFLFTKAWTCCSTYGNL
jgi:hypothetical protein